MDLKRVLMIAPFPPPFNGNSLPVKKIYDHLLAKRIQAVPLNLNKISLVNGTASFDRIKQILRVYRQTFKNRKDNRVIYFSISESFAGNLKDLIIYIILFKYHHKLVIHMLGGAGMRVILKRQLNLLSIINRFFIRRLAGVIVEGSTQKLFFQNVIAPEKVHVIPNFAEDYLFTKKEDIGNKFSETNLLPLKVLFLSNLIYGKGHEELLEAYLSLPNSIKQKITVDFAGGFDLKEKEDEFVRKIATEKGLTYHGSVKGEEKAKLYRGAHVFCLPTYYPYEGQPFSIIEAYAGGCVVATTNHSGIFNIFNPKKNGFEVDKKSVSSLVQLFEKLVLSDNSHLCKMAMNNFTSAQTDFTSKLYLQRIEAVFQSIGN